MKQTRKAVHVFSILYYLDVYGFPPSDDIFAHLAYYPLNDIIFYPFLSSILHTFFIENDAEILCVLYTWKVAFTNLIHKQSIRVKL
jgi:hypothetical protein